MSEQHFRPHAAHRGKSQLPCAADLSEEELPSCLLHPDSEPIRAMLEQLDDVIFAAVTGDSEALQQAYTLWPQVVDALGWELVEESREQYLRFALDVTERLQRNDQRTPECAVAALEIITLLSKES